MFDCKLGRSFHKTSIERISAARGKGRESRIATSIRAHKKDRIFASAI